MMWRCGAALSGPRLLLQSSSQHSTSQPTEILEGDARHLLDGSLAFSFISEKRRHHTQRIRPILREDEAGIDTDPGELAGFAGRLAARRQPAPQPALLRFLQQRDPL